MCDPPEHHGTEEEHEGVARHQAPLVAEQSLGADVVKTSWCVQGDLEALRLCFVPAQVDQELLEQETCLVNSLHGNDL